MRTRSSIIATIALLVFATHHALGAIPFNESRPRMESRDGNSVDTATGGFIQNLKLFALQEGSRSLEFSLSYHSLLVTTKGYVGYGWSSPYEARIRGDANSVVSVFLNGNIANQFQFAGAGQPYTPLNIQNRYDVLTRVTEGDLAGVLKLRRLSGTTYYFEGEPTADGFYGNVYKLFAIQNVTGNTIEVTQGVAGISQINVGAVGTYLFYRPIGAPLLHYLVHGADRTFLQYDANDRLSRIYDPVGLETIGERSVVTPIPEGAGGVLYPIVVTKTETNRLLRVGAGGVTHAKPATLQAFLISPTGHSVPIHVPASGVQLFLDAFLGENPAGTWNLKIVDTLNDGITGSVNGFRIERSTEPANWTQYAYDVFPLNRITRATDSKGQRVFSNSYDAFGRVSVQDDARDDNGLWRFQYEPQPNGDLLTTVFDRTPAAYPTRYRHDSDFHLKLVQDPLGAQTQYAYDPVTGNRTSITDARGNVTRFTYDATGHLASTTAPNQAVTTFGHDARGNLTSVTDGLNFKTTFTYDEFNNLTGSVNALANQQTQIYADGRLGGTVNKDGNGVVFDRDATSGLVTSAQVIGGPQYTKFEYDGSGRATKVIDPDGAVSTMAYDRRGNILEKRNALGHQITSVHDHRNRLASETDAAGNVTLYEYDGNGNLTRTTEPLGKITRIEYDGEDRAMRVTGPNGTSTQSTFDPLGRVIQKTDELGHTTSFTFDAGGNQIAIFGPNGVKLSETAYNNLDVAVSQKNAYGQATVFEYDLLGQRTSQTDARGKKTQFKLDPLGRVDQVIDPLARQFRKFFAPGDVVDKVVDAAGKETKFTYTKLHEVETITTPRGAVTKLEYTTRGHILRYTPPSLTRAQEYMYNSVGRLSRTKHLNAVPAVPDKVYAYDQNANLTNISTQAGAGAVVPQITRAYDQLNRQTSNTDADGKQVRHFYDAASRVTQVIYPDSKTVSYTYDSAGRLLTVTDWASRVTRYAWNAFNKLVSIQFPNQTTRALQYDDAGRLLGRADFDSSGAPIVSYQYSYDANGYITCECLHKDPVAYEPPVTSFVYDDDNRLTQRGAVALTYDPDGNVTQGPVGGQSTALAWNSNNLLRQAGSLVFNYDVEDRLTGWQSGAEAVKFSVVEASGGAQILVNESTLGTTTRYVYGVGLAYEEVNGQLRVYHQDERGNTMALSNAAGQVSGTIAYSPYGEEIGHTGVTDTIFKHGGLFGVVTAPNGLNNMRFRWYSPEMHRFISIDSSLGDISLPSSLNRYTYGGNNPINFNDPDGEFIHIFVGAIVGAVVGAVTELVSSAIEGKPVNWNKVGSAALGGLVGGAISAAGAPMLAGAAASITTDLVDAAVEGRAVDWGGLATGAVTGAITGKIGAGIGSKVGAKWTSYTIKKAASKSIARGALGEPGIMFLKNPLVRLATKTTSQIVKAESIKAAIKLPFKVGGKVLDDTVDTKGLLTGILSPGSSGDGSGPPARVGKIIQGATALPGIYVGKGGEYQHSQSYLDALDAADRPFPDTSSRLTPF